MLFSNQQTCSELFKSNFSTSIKFIENVPIDKYYIWYYNLILKSKERLCNTDTYYEKHHIFPKFMQIDNSESNLVKVTAREHYILHRLLTKICKNIDSKTYGKSVYSVIVFSSSKYHGNRKKAPSRIINLYRPILREIRAEMGRKTKGRKHTTETRHKMSINHWSKRGTIKHPLLGRKHTEESKSLMSKSSTKHFWKAIDPLGHLYEIESINTFCKKNNLNLDAIRKFEGKIIPEPGKTKGAIQKITETRKNSVGWLFTRDLSFDFGPQIR